MSRVVLVHGAFNELWGPHEILARWIPALRDGLWHAGVDVAPDDIDCAFYGDLFRLDPDAGDVVDPADLAAKSGLVDVINSIPGSEHLATLANAVGKAANERMLDQLGRFLAAGDVRRTVRERVDRVLGPDTELVVAHSLGTLVSYQVLAARPELSTGTDHDGLAARHAVRVRPAHAGAGGRGGRLAGLGAVLDQHRRGGGPRLRRQGPVGQVR